MAVLIEGISVVVRRERIEESYPGGWAAFVRNVPNSTLCADDHLARVMSPEAVQAFVAQLSGAGLQFLDDGQAMELAVIDQRQGPTTRVDWSSSAYRTDSASIAIVEPAPCGISQSRAGSD